MSGEKKVPDFIDVTKGKDGVDGNKYADMLAVAQELEKHGIKWRQKTQLVEGNLYVFTAVQMPDVEKMGDFECPVPVIIGNSSRMSEMQALGSAITYARRYSLQTATNCIPTDADAEGTGSKQDNGNSAAHITNEQWNSLLQVCQSLNLNPKQYSENIIKHGLSKPLDLHVDEYAAIMDSLGAKY